MKIAFVINDLETEIAEYTSMHLAMAAHNGEHETWVVGTGDFRYDPGTGLMAHGYRAKGKRYRSTRAYRSALEDADDARERIRIGELDVLFLRNNPAEDVDLRPWAQAAGFMFGDLALLDGVIVVNHPPSLAHAINKIYFQEFPDVVRPRTLISRAPEEIRDFAKAQKSGIVLKPLQGSGGERVFLVRRGGGSNLNQIIETVVRDGYVVAQEYLPAAREGDVRMFVMNGVPLQVDGRYAAFRRVPQDGDPRSNMHAGGRPERVEMTDELLGIAEVVRPKLIQDGMFLVGLDVVGDKLLEVNVFSPGGLGTVQKMEKVDFPAAVIQALERKVRHRATFGTAIPNVTMATL